MAIEEVRWVVKCEAKPRYWYAVVYAASPLRAITLTAHYYKRNRLISNLHEPVSVYKATIVDGIVESTGEPLLKDHLLGDYIDGYR